MAAVTGPHPDPVAPSGAAQRQGAARRLVRFDPTERVVHWSNATLFLILIATGASLYVPSLSALVGRRELVRNVHVYAGLALPLPVLLGAAGRRWGSALRGDLARINRWSSDDVRWFRSLSRDPMAELGKFNPGQKLNAAFTGGAILVMLGTGSILHWYKPFPLGWRTGATFVHDWVAVLLFCTISGHILFAFSDREALGAMVGGRVSARWAARHAPRWRAEVEAAAEAGRAEAAQS